MRLQDDGKRSTVQMEFLPNRRMGGGGIVTTITTDLQEGKFEVLPPPQSVITQNASCSTFIFWGAANFRFVIFSHFSTFYPAPLIAPSAIQIQPSHLPQYVIRAEKCDSQSHQETLCCTNMHSLLYKYEISLVQICNLCCTNM